MSPSKKANKTKSSAQQTRRKSKKVPVRSASPKPAAGAATAVIHAKPKTSWLTKGLRLFALLAVVAITVFVYSIRERVSEFAAFGYPGIFLIALMANATIFLPAPGVALIYAMGSIFHPLGVGLAAGFGGAIGELSGYLAGFSGQAVIERTDIYERIAPFVEKYGAWAILVLSAIPNPFFDVAGVAAGIVKMPMWKFLSFALVGQIIKMTLFAYAGKYSIDWLATYFE